MTDSTAPISDFGGLVERVTVLHNTSRWPQVYGELRTVLGEPAFTDGRSWAAFESVSLGDETDLPPWCLLARTRDLDGLAARARETGWQVGAPEEGGHEIRVLLTAPSGLVVIAYTPVSP